MSDFKQLRDSLGVYIADYPPPSKEQNTQWLQELDNLDKNSKKYDKIRRQMILSNGGFAMKYVMKYKGVLNDDVSIMDLFQEATLGIIETIDTFDVSLGISFTTYAYFHVRKRLIDFIKHNKLVRAPRDVARNLKHVNETRSKLYTDLTREPSSEEITTELKKHKDIDLKENMVRDIVNLLELNSAATDTSFINEFNEQTAHDEQDCELFRLMESSIESRIKKFPEISAKMIKLRFGIGCDSPHTLEEINYMLDLDDETQKVITFTPESDRHLVT